ncbi:Gmad2 immunoglobulin-like domain-containing protein [Neobacillus kokaensis]|uniref:Bacterial spore germination immunoglobulin-like domain-containing protein n=1 Tax=Neobacillus kokaensis TaxID=2759023 RepID=A0ABQ3N524_9BACI|nr:Gmad2 immunoglobulin-like domain-containing protein [Neobacillus kokaensis]GHH98722.1 hypothetical protein AM1BK_22650 [Neobacillus kokaensis]
MKKVIYFLLALIAAVGLSACSPQKDVKEPDGGKVVEQPKGEEPAKEEPAKEEPPKEEPVKEEPAAEPDEPATYQNEAFKEVVVTESDDQIVVTGKAQVFEGVFQYKLSEGDKVLLEDHYQTAGAPAWGDFTITFGKNLISSDSALFELFVYSAKDGSKINVLEIPIQK